MSEAEKARAWVRVLATYRDPSTARSLFELAATAIPFFALWAIAWGLLTIHPLLALPPALLNGFFLVRLFTIQHDCGHGAFFNSRFVNDWLGRGLGVLTLTPYDVWKRSHAIHHAGSGNLDQRGIGDVNTLTVAEYRALSPFGRLRYRAYRHPLVLFGVGPAWLFLWENRLSYGPPGACRKTKRNLHLTNFGIAAMLIGLFVLGGWKLLVLVFLPTALLAATLGVWLFYVQHQFEETHWEGDPDWQLHEAALHGSSHYVMPSVLQWLTANIGIHHVHHLYSRIPFYRLPEVLRDHAELADAQRLTIRESFACARFHLWDQQQRRLMSFREARRLYGPIPA
ncbi:fatty acid desaturase [Algicella marina]|uniref:Fatty acid desaturase n=2 Tax=Algicella marina TaxID=2683284 RepID=A0A6P1T3W5_9RHOB|nr:fatty acid desaturase [Algicella marina]QHQ37438.1 fatty acid desaturase [Algicella marina]